MKVVIRRIVWMIRCAAECLALAPHAVARGKPSVGAAGPPAQSALFASTPQGCCSSRGSGFQQTP